MWRTITWDTKSFLLSRTLNVHVVSDKVILVILGQKNYNTVAKTGTVAFFVVLGFRHF